MTNSSNCSKLSVVPPSRAAPLVTACTVYTTALLPIFAQRSRGSIRPGHGLPPPMVLLLQLLLLLLLLLPSAAAVCAPASGVCLQLCAD